MTKSKLKDVFIDDRASALVKNLLSQGKFKSLDEIVSYYYEKKNSSIKMEYKTKIDAGNYETIEAIVTALNANKLLQKDRIEFRINDGSKKIFCASMIPSLKEVKMSTRLSLQLGFEPYSNILNASANHPSNMLLGLPAQLFVYSDIVEPQIIGDVFAKIIRVVALDNSQYIYGSQKVQFFTRPHYIPVLKREFENIEIDIRTSVGEFAPFQHGTVCVKLHFKKLSQ